MFRKIVFLAILFAATNVYGQQNGNTTTAAKPKPVLTPTVTPKTPDATPKIDYSQVGAPMPPIILTTFDSLLKSEQNKWHEIWHTKKNRPYLTNDDLKNVKGNLFVMMFNPTCGHCANETDLLEKNMDLFKKSRLVLLCNPVMKNNLPDFMKTHKTIDYPKMTIGLDSIGFMGKAFLYRMLPQINVYDKDQNLIKIFTGDIAIDSMKSYIQ